MKKLIAVSVLAVVIASSTVYADQQSYTDIREQQPSVSATRQLSSEEFIARAQEQQQRMDQALRSYEMNYNDSYTRFWDRYTDAYQKSKKVN